MGDSLLEQGNLILVVSFEFVPLLLGFFFGGMGLLFVHFEDFMGCFVKFFVLIEVFEGMVKFGLFLGDLEVEFFDLDGIRLEFDFEWGQSGSQAGLLVVEALLLFLIVFDDGRILDLVFLDLLKFIPERINLQCFLMNLRF